MRRRSSDNHDNVIRESKCLSEKITKLTTFVIILSAFTLWSSFGVRSAWSSALVSGTLLTQSNFDLRFPTDLPQACRRACELSFHTKQELFLCSNEKLRKKKSRDQKWMSAFEEVFSHHYPLNPRAEPPGFCALQGCEVFFFFCAFCAELAVLLALSFCCVSSRTQSLVKQNVFRLTLPCWTSPCLRLLYFLSTFSFS